MRTQPETLERLAEQINSAHDGVVTGWRTSLEHARRAGELLREAQALVEQTHGKRKFKGWADANTNVKGRTREVYMQVARHWPEIEASPQFAADTTLDGALKLIRKPRQRPKDKADAQPEVVPAHTPSVAQHSVRTDTQRTSVERPKNGQAQAVEEVKSGEAPAIPVSVAFPGPVQRVQDDMGQPPSGIKVTARLEGTVTFLLTPEEGHSIEEVMTSLQSGAAVVNGAAVLLDGQMIATLEQPDILPSYRDWQLASAKTRAA